MSPRSRVGWMAKLSRVFGRRMERALTTIGEWIVSTTCENQTYSSYYRLIKWQFISRSPRAFQFSLSTGQIAIETILHWQHVIYFCKTTPSSSIPALPHMNCCFSLTTTPPFRRHIKGWTVLSLFSIVVIRPAPNYGQMAEKWHLFPSRRSCQTHVVCCGDHANIC